MVAAFSYPLNHISIITVNNLTDNLTDRNTTKVSDDTRERF